MSPIPSPFSTSKILVIFGCCWSIFWLPLYWLPCNSSPTPAFASWTEPPPCEPKWPSCQFSTTELSIWGGGLGGGLGLHEPTLDQTLEFWGAARLLCPAGHVLVFKMPPTEAIHLQNWPWQRKVSWYALQGHENTINMIGWYWMFQASKWFERLSWNNNAQPNSIKSKQRKSSVIMLRRGLAAVKAWPENGACAQQMRCPWAPRTQETLAPTLRNDAGTLRGIPSGRVLNGR